MKSKHTSGTWKANGLPDASDPADRLARAVWVGEKPICTTAFGIGRYNALSPEEQDANAKRIAACVNACDGINPEAVPHMKAVLEELHFWARENKIGEASHERLYEIIANGDAALAKVFTPPSTMDRCHELAAAHIEKYGPGDDVQIEFERLSGKYHDAPEDPVWHELERALLAEQERPEAKKTGTVAAAWCDERQRRAARPPSATQTLWF